ncbi:unnamed protein product [Heterobilharzia americana]|nr:unnamed protein product [Heterobilharzia americana]
MNDVLQTLPNANSIRIAEEAISLLSTIYTCINNGNIQSITENDVDNIKSLLEGLRSLNIMRCQAHQVLETESIKVAILRTKLQQFKEEKVKEIFDKRNLVRMLNENELNNLEESLRIIKSNYQQGELALEQLTRKLELLRFRELRSNEENIVTIEALNSCLDNKANKQIFLNQKLEEIKTTELKEKEVQKMLDHLNAEITEERRNAVRRIIKLEEETKRVKKALEIQKAKNAKLEKPHQKVSEELRRNRFEEFSLSKNVDELSASIQLEIQSGKEKRNVIQRSLDKLLKEHKDSLENMQKQLEQIEKSQETSSINIKAYEEKKKILTAGLSLFLVYPIFSVVKIEKEYMAKAEATAQLQEEIDGMLEKIENLNSSSKSLIDNLKQQAETMKTHLAVERKERVQVQRKQRKLQKQMLGFSDEQNLYVRKYHRRINEAKSKLSVIDKEKNRLNEECRTNQEKANGIQLKMKSEKEIHDSERLHGAEKIASLSKMLDDSNEVCQQWNKKINDELPKLEALNNEVKKNEAIESETKSAQVEMNQTIRTLEAEIRRVNEENKKLEFDLSDPSILKNKAAAIESKWPERAKSLQYRLKLSIEPLKIVENFYLELFRSV